MNATGSPALRDANLDKLRGPPFDVLVLGGGINGAATAAALSARGARVALLERRDFGSVTSQESSNLVWGGIKYLETYELGLVRKLCKARNELLRAFPSSVEEIRFYASHPRGFRHGKRTLILGTWLYWALGSFLTRPPRPCPCAPWSGRSRSSPSRGWTAASNTPMRSCPTATPGLHGGF